MRAAFDDAQSPLRVTRGFVNLLDCGAIVAFASDMLRPHGTASNRNLLLRRSDRSCV